MQIEHYLVHVIQYVKCSIAYCILYKNSFKDGVDVSLVLFGREFTKDVVGQSIRPSIKSVAC